MGQRDTQRSGQSTGILLQVQTGGVETGCGARAERHQLPEFTEVEGTGGPQGHMWVGEGERSCFPSPSRSSTAKHVIPMSRAAWKRHRLASTTQGMCGQERRHFPGRKWLYRWEMGPGPGTKHQHDLLERLTPGCCCPGPCASTWENQAGGGWLGQEVTRGLPPLCGHCAWDSMSSTSPGTSPCWPGMGTWGPLAP